MNLGCRGSRWDLTDRKKKGPEKSKIEMAEASDAMRCCDLPADPSVRASAGALHIKNTRCRDGHGMRKRERRRACLVYIPGSHFYRKKQIP